MFSAATHLTLRHGVHSLSSKEHDEVYRIEWHNLFRSFGSVKTLWTDYRLAMHLFCYLVLTVTMKGFFRAITGAAKAHVCLGIALTAMYLHHSLMLARTQVARNGRILGPSVAQANFLSSHPLKLPRPHRRAVRMRMALTLLHANYRAVHMSPSLTRHRYYQPEIRFTPMNLLHTPQ